MNIDSIAALGSYIIFYFQKVLLIKVYSVPSPYFQALWAVIETLPLATPPLAQMSQHGREGNKEIGE